MPAWRGDGIWGELEMTETAAHVDLDIRKLICNVHHLILMCHKTRTTITVAFLRVRTFEIKYLNCFKQIRGSNKLIQQRFRSDFIWDFEFFHKKILKNLFVLKRLDKLLIDVKWISNTFDDRSSNCAKITNILWFQLLIFFVLYHRKLTICGFWILDCWSDKTRYSIFAVFWNNR